MDLIDEEDVSRLHAGQRAHRSLPLVRADPRSRRPGCPSPRPRHACGLPQSGGPCNGRCSMVPVAGWPRRVRCEVDLEDATVLCRQSGRSEDAADDSVSAEVFGLLGCRNDAILRHAGTPGRDESVRVDLQASRSSFHCIGSVHSPQKTEEEITGHRCRQPDVHGPPSAARGCFADPLGDLVPGADMPAPRALAQQLRADQIGRSGCGDTVSSGSCLGRSVRLLRFRCRQQQIGRTVPRWAVACPGCWMASVNSPCVPCR